MDAPFPSSTFRTYPPAREVSHDLVDSVMDAAGYRTHLWLAPACWTTVAGAVVSFQFLALYGWPAAVVALAAAAFTLIWLVRLQRDWGEHTLALRNALERRLGLPEHARHRESYPRIQAHL